MPPEDDEPPDMENPQLDQAAKDGDLQSCKILVEKWKQDLFPAKITTEHLRPAFAVAVGAKHTDVVTFLLDQGVTISSNAMILALGDTDDAIAMFQTFLDHGWDINSKTDLGVPMLKYDFPPSESGIVITLSSRTDVAICRHVVRDETLTHYFLDHGADPNAVGNGPGSTILDVAAANTSPAVFDMLLNHGAKLQDSDALHSAAGERVKRLGRLEMMDHLLHLGMDINALWRREYPPSRRMGRGTPLHAAVSAQEVDRIKFLLGRGADMEKKNTLDQTPLEYAVAKGLHESERALSDAKTSSAS